MRIRRGAPPDARALAAFAARTFEEAFGPDNDPQDMALYLSSAYGPRQQDEELASADVITLLAEHDGRLAAYAQVRRAAAPECVLGLEPVELWRFYVDGPWQGKGVAQRLMAAVHAAARELGGRTLWLSVWERNGRARAFYAKCGFEDVGVKDFWLGEDRQSDRVMTVAVGAA